MTAAFARSVPRSGSMGFTVARAFALIFVVLGLSEALFFGIAGWLDAATLESLFPGAAPHRLHGITLGIISGVLVLCIVVQLWDPRQHLAAALLGVVALSSYTLGALPSGTLDPLALVGLAIVAAMAWLHPARGGAEFMPLNPLAIVSAVPLLIGVAVFAGTELQAQVTAAAADEHAQFGHYALMAATAVTVAGAAVIGSSSLRGAWLAGWLGVGAALAFGVASIVYPTSVSSVGVAPGVTLIVLASAFGAGLVATRHRVQRSVEAMAN